ncbi:hypothetical protein ACRALDRAFT_211117 [Sodiomyces alcalophilus JCM 7366]|uniref:uncharacterized protein n=1 Tax=Sodiomyces alcalophilus JCM 7366 TaxID=591952 RepID=UPI0039B50D2B
MTESCMWEKSTKYVWEEENLFFSGPHRRNGITLFISMLSQIRKDFEFLSDFKVDHYLIYDFSSETSCLLNTPTGTAVFSSTGHSAIDWHHHPSKLPTLIAARAQPSTINLFPRPFSTTAITNSSSSSSSSSSISIAQNQYPPESPHWLPVPKARQSHASEAKPARVKGVLPTPRPIFTDRRGIDRRVQPGYLEKTAPLPTSESATRPVRPGSVLDVRRRLAASRRANLEAGLEGLWRRRSEHQSRLRAASASRNEANRVRALAPEREDDILTRSSVLRATVEQTAVLPDPDRFARAEASRARTAELAQRRAEDRRDALTALYMSAGDFIVEEDHLAAEIDRVFSADYFTKQAKSYATDATSAWDVWGPPPTLQRLSAASTRPGQEFDSIDHDRTVKRQKTIAENLTGGKMD